MIKLTINDYKNILKFYNKTIPKSKTLLKSQANKIIANKLCKCIKKNNVENEALSIGICTKAIINNKGYTRGKFSCKNKPQIILSKKKTRKIKY